MKRRIIPNEFEAKSPKLNLYHGEVLGVKVVSTEVDQVIRIINERVQLEASSKPYFIATVNPEFVMVAQEDKAFKDILNKADLPVADGKGLRWADAKINQFTPGRELVKCLVEAKKYKIFFLGGRNGVAAEMGQRYGGQADEGHENVRIKDAKYEQQDVEIVKKINQYKPDIVLVAYGAPWQEKWIYEHWDKLKTRVVVGVGGSFDYLTGRAKLPPKWMSGLGLEWLWRLVNEPWRWRRQLRLIKYLGLVIQG